MTKFNPAALVTSTTGREPGADDEDAAEEGETLTTVGDTLWAAALAKAAEDLGAGTSKASAQKYARPLFVPALSLFTGEDDGDAPMLVEGLVPEKGLTVQASSPKAGKTWIEEELAVAVATATPAFGEFATLPGERAVCLVLCEDSYRSTRGRLRGAAASRDMSPEQALGRVHVVCRPHLDLLNPADLALIVASARQIPNLALVIIDPLRDAWVGSEVESMDAVTRVLRQLVSVLDCAVFITHHNRKQGTQDKGPPADPGDEMRGGSELLGRMDSGIFPWRKTSTAPNVIDLLVRTKTRDGEPLAPFDLRLEIENKDRRVERVRWTVIRGGGGGGEESVVSALRKLNEEHPACYHDIKAVARRAGLKEREAQDALSSLLFAKKVERGAARNAWRLHHGTLLGDAA
jgi:hypothetical protein